MMVVLVMMMPSMMMIDDDNGDNDDGGAGDDYAVDNDDDNDDNGDGSDDDDDDYDSYVYTSMISQLKRNSDGNCLTGTHCLASLAEVYSTIAHILLILYLCLQDDFSSEWKMDGEFVMIGGRE